MSGCKLEKHSQALTRADLRAAIFQKLPHYSRLQITKLVDAVFEEIILAFLNEETVKLRRFGTFKVRNKRQRIGRNPKNGVEAIITPRRVITFYPSLHLVAAMNNEESMDSENED